MGQCKAVTNKGNQCKNKAVENGYCKVHSRKQSSDISTESRNSYSNKISSPPQVFSILFLFVGVVACGFTTIFLKDSNTNEFINIIASIGSLFIPVIFGRGLDYMFFINNHNLGENISNTLYTIIAIFYAIVVAVIAFGFIYFSIDNRFFSAIAGIIVAIIAGTIAFLHFKS